MLFSMAMNKNLEAIYNFIRAYVEQNGRPPRIVDIASDCNLSPETVIRCLDMLEARGLIVREAGKHRGLKLTERQR